MFCGDQLLASYLRPSNIDGARHAWALLALLTKRLRRAWPRVEIVFRGDSGFCRRRMLAWRERNDVKYIVGIARNAALSESAAPWTEVARAEAARAYERSGEKQRLFGEFRYAAGTWKQRGG